MNAQALEKILSRFLPFCKKLPNFITNPKHKYEALVVSGFYPGMLKLIKDSFSVVEDYDYSQTVDTKFPVIQVGDFLVEKKNDEFISLIINKQHFIIHNGGDNPLFTYYNKHAYLGGILFCALKHYYKDFTIQSDGIYLSKYDYIKPNSNTLILEEKVTGNFFDLISLFELPVEPLVKGFFIKESYFDFLLESRYINTDSLHSLKNCDSEFLNEFYQYVESHRKNEAPNPKLSEEQIFYVFPKFRLNHFKKKYQHALHFQTQISEKLDFNKITDALKHLVKDKKETGILFAQYKSKRFSSKQDLETFTYVSSQEKILEDIVSFASQNTTCIMKEIGWVVQENLSSDRVELERVFKAHNIPHEFVTYIPFDDNLPEFNKERLNIFYGAVGFIDKVFNNHDFRSCIFFEPSKFRMDNYIEQWKERMLSSDAIITTMGKIPELAKKFENDTDLFIRPVEDSKLFDGSVRPFKEIMNWKESIRPIKDNVLDENTEILISEPYKINKEWRNIIINGKVVSSSRYMKNQQLSKDADDIPEEMIKFCETSCQIYTPDDVFVMDIGETGGDYYIIECGCFNSVGFYKSDIERIVLEVTNYAKTFMWKFEGL